MTRYIVLKVSSIFVIAIGMTGLYFHVEYAGWVLFVGCLLVL